MGDLRYGPRPGAGVVDTLARVGAVVASETGDRSPVQIVKKTGASLNRGGSRQDYGTDPRFVEAVRQRFGPIDFDLAASEANTLAPRYYTEVDDALGMDWSLLDGHLWCNPPHGASAMWAKKCADTAQEWVNRHVEGPSFISLLVPAAVGSNWFADFVDGIAMVYALRPRLTFVGEKDPYPRDLLLCVYGGEVGFKPWKWR